MRKLLNLFEDELNTHDIQSVFKAASSAEPGGWFNKREPVTIDQLQQAWIAAGRPDDVRDIQKILASLKFKDGEIKKILASVLDADEDGGYNTLATSPAVMKIVNYAKENGLEQQIIDFLKSEYQFSESVKHNKPVVFEDIRSILNSAAQLSANPVDNTYVQMGRNRKQ